MGKKSKSNGKAKHRAEEFDIHFLPPPWRKLTPERAKEWLREDFHAWQELVEHCSRGGFDPSYLRVSIGYMVTACERAIDSGRAVLLTADEFKLPRKGFVPSWNLVSEPLLFLEAALRNEFESTEFGEIRAPLLALVQEMKKAAKRGQREQGRLHAAARERIEANAKPDPAEFQKLEADRKALEDERDAALEAVSKPWDERIEALKDREIEIKRQFMALEPPSSMASSPTHLFQRAMLASEIEHHDKGRRRAEARA
jgi:hypothetical protein